MKKIISILLILIGLFGIISSLWILPSLKETNIRADYDKYYEQAQNDIECKKIETQAVCNKASEEVNVSTNESVMSYSFNTEDEYGYRHKTYYDADIEYKKAIHMIVHYINFLA